MWRIIKGDCRDVLPTLPVESVHTCVTSPPYFGLRDYGTDGQIGLEPTPDEFVSALVDVFREVRRVLRDDGTVWLNLGDSYAGVGAQWGGTGSMEAGRADRMIRGADQARRVPTGCKPKDLLGVPWLVAFALRADGWYLRSDIVWSKPNPMPESVTDRPTKAHEYVFLLSKGPRYFYDADAIREPLAANTLRDCSIERPRTQNGGGSAESMAGHVPGRPFGTFRSDEARGANKRTVWTVATQPYAGAHFATFPPKLIEPCILAGCPEGGTVLDPFAGSGTTGMVALRHNRSFVGIELSPSYAAMARERIVGDAPLLNQPIEQVA